MQTSTWKRLQHILGDSGFLLYVKPSKCPICNHRCTFSKIFLDEYRGVAIIIAHNAEHGITSGDFSGGRHPVSGLYRELPIWAVCL